MIRPYLPEWLKADGTEFALEVISAMALMLVMLNRCEVI